MKQNIIIISSFLALTHCRTSGELCRGTAQLSQDGNWYCSEVWAITYRNISQPGAYNRTTYVDPSTGLCGHERLDYPASGPDAPLFGEVSMHLRGPMNVSQLAVYQLPSDMDIMQKRSTVPFYNQRDNHGILRTDRRTYNTTASCSRMTVTSTVTISDCTATADTGHLRNTTYIGPPLPCLPTPRSSTTDISQPTPSCTCRNRLRTTDFTQKRIQTASTPAFTPDLNTAVKRDVDQSIGADWKRVAYYTSASPAQATGMSFLANLGDRRKSGTFDYAFGNSLAYVTSDGRRVASESLPFDGTLETSELEIAVFSDKQCDQDCPYWRPDATSHFGWSGSSKAFLIEFQMDHYQNRGTDQGLISDAPAWWFLNAAIPRILQYGNDRNNIPCSCWSTGCGEFDAFEVLGNGEERAKSTIHRPGSLEGGDSNYFKRPVEKSMKFAVIWHYPHITAMVLDDGFEFGARLSDEQIKKLVRYDAES